MLKRLLNLTPEIKMRPEKITEPPTKIEFYLDGTHEDDLTKTLTRVFRSALILIYNHQKLTPLDIHFHAGEFKQNAIFLMNIKPRGLKAFCDLLKTREFPGLSPSTIIATDFFQSIKNQDVVFQNEVRDKIAPIIIRNITEISSDCLSFVPAISTSRNAAKRAETQKVCEWMAEVIKSRGLLYGN